MITNVWGDRHTDLFLTLTLPNILSAQNLPKLAELGDITYRIFTTPTAKEQIEASSPGRQLGTTFSTEYITPLGDRTPEPIWHVHWFHRAAAEAKKAGAFVFFVPPDTLWTDGSFAHMAEHLAAGKRGVACPFILVVSDTVVPDARREFLDAADGTLCIPPAEMWPFARRHMHPNQILAMPDAPHSRPVFELHWPVAREGLLSRYAFRELAAFDPARIPITFLWCPDGPEDLNGIHFATDSEDMLMLSVDPIGKYLENCILDHSAHAFDVSRMTLHPLNNTAQTRSFLSHQVRAYSGARNVRAWSRRERAAESAARDIRVGRAAMLVSEKLIEHGCEVMATLLAVALFDAKLTQQFRAEPPLAAFATRDAAFSGAERRKLLGFAAPGHEQALRRFLLSHVFVGPLSDGTVMRTLGGTTMTFAGSGSSSAVNDVAVIAGPIDLEGVQLYILDGAVVSPDQSVAALTARGPNGAEFALIWRAIKRRIGALLRGAGAPAS